jgi:hypothetical protein
MAIITAPSIIMALDDSVDVSIFYSLSEEEEEENESFKLVFSGNEVDIDYLGDSLKNYNLGYFFKNYSKPHLNLISPPPDFI